MATKHRQEMAFFTGSGGSAAVSLQFHIVHTPLTHHTKGDPWNIF